MARHKMFNRNITDIVENVIIILKNISPFFMSFTNTGPFPNFK